MLSVVPSNLHVPMIKHKKQANENERKKERKKEREKDRNNYVFFFKRLLLDSL